MANFKVTQKKSLYIAVIAQLGVVLFIVYMCNYHDSNTPLIIAPPAQKMLKGAASPVDLQKVQGAREAFEDTLDYLNGVLDERDYNATDFGTPVDTDGDNGWSPDFKVEEGALPAFSNSDVKDLRKIIYDLDMTIKDSGDNDKDDEVIFDDDSDVFSRLLGRAWRRLQKLWGRAVGIETQDQTRISTESHYERFLKWSANDTLDGRNETSLLKKANEFREKLVRINEDASDGSLEENQLLRISEENGAAFDTRVNLTLPVRIRPPGSITPLVVNGTKDFLTHQGLDQRYPSYTDFINRLTILVAKHSGESYVTRTVLSQLKSKGVPAPGYLMERIIRDSNGGKDFVEPQWTPDPSPSCWKKEGTLYCVPAAYLLGFTRSATSDLFYRLTSHPQLTFTLKVQNRPNKQRTGSLFSLAASSRYEGILAFVKSRTEPKTFVFGRTPKYRTVFLFDLHQYEPYKELLQAQATYEINPQTKFVVIMRNPIDAAFSEYGRAASIFNPSIGKSRKKWALFVKDIARQCISCMKKKDVFWCKNDPPRSLTKIKVNLFDYAYAISIANWMKIFPKEQFFFIKYEEYANVTKRQLILQEVFNFLGARNLTKDELHTLAAMGRINFISMKYQSPHLLAGMSTATRNILHAFYRPFNEALVELIEDDRFLWE